MIVRQLDMFPAPPSEPVVWRGETPGTVAPDPDRIRARLAKIVGEARAATSHPWDDRTLRLYRTIVPQMASALPDDEAAEIVAAFTAELERLFPLPDPIHRAPVRNERS